MVPQYSRIGEIKAGLATVNDPFVAAVLAVVQPMAEGYDVRIFEHGLSLSAGRADGLDMTLAVQGEQVELSFDDIVIEVADVATATGLLVKGMRGDLRVIKVSMDGRTVSAELELDHPASGWRSIAGYGGAPWLRWGALHRACKRNGSSHSEARATT